MDARADHNVLQLAGLDEMSYLTLVDTDTCGELFWGFQPFGFVLV